MAYHIVALPLPTRPRVRLLHIVIGSYKHWAVLVWCGSVVVVC